MEPIITSLLDQDLYKLSMAQVVWEKHPATEVRYRYKCRNEVNLDSLAPAIRWQLDSLGDLRTTEEENEYIAKIRYVKPGFASFFRRFQLDPKQVKIKTGPFRLEVDGTWNDAIFWEIFVLSTISEVYYQDLVKRGELEEESSLKKADTLLTEKIKLLKEGISDTDMPFRLIEFGTRRRYSKSWQEHVLARLLNEAPEAVFGTSNVNLARTHNIRPIGTMAHEYFQAFQSLGRLRDSQKMALQTWADVYRGDLGIALTDVISMDAFLKDFDLYFSKLFDGMRHDSGDPKIWGEKAIKHYEGFNIDPRSKALVFSDSLTIQKALDLWRLFEPRIKTSYGIGTHLTCDIPGLTTLNHVLKMIYCNGSPVAKLSDAIGKGMSDDEAFVAYLKKVFNYQVK